MEVDSFFYMMWAYDGRVTKIAGVYEFVVHERTFVEFVEGRTFLDDVRDIAAYKMMRGGCLQA